MFTAVLLATLLLAAWGTVVLVYRTRLTAAWREPVLRAPVLIVESDDWGPGPDCDAQRLRELARVLASHRDRYGRAAVVSIGVVLSLPDPVNVADPRAGRTFLRLTLADRRFRAVREALLAGSDKGVFALQLHGMEHYWPPSLLAVARRDTAVESWIRRSPSSRTEELPAPLQMRWSDATRLPSRPIPAAEIERAVEQEIAAFGEIFGKRPDVVVPPTFVWDARVEMAWAAGGVRTVVTPGRRFVGRDAAGRLVEDPLCAPYNGHLSDTGVTYVVRDRYFEPARGHRAEDALGALEEKTRAGRPTLLETHRDNFINDELAAADSLAQLDRLLATALQRFPDLRFMSTDELASALRARDAGLVESRVARRVHAWLVRLSENDRLRKLAWVTVLAIPAWLLLMATRRDPRPASDLGLRSQSFPQ